MVATMMALQPMEPRSTITKLTTTRQQVMEAFNTMAPPTRPRLQPLPLHQHPKISQWWPRQLSMWPKTVTLLKERSLSVMLAIRDSDFWTHGTKVTPTTKCWNSNIDRDWPTKPIAVRWVGTSIPEWDQVPSHHCRMKRIKRTMFQNRQTCRDWVKVGLSVSSSNQSQPRVPLILRLW